jgi:hypothetical protein
MICGPAPQSEGAAFGHLGAPVDFLVLAADDNAGARSIKAGVYNGDA